MEFDEQKINKMYRKDTRLVIIFIVFVWIVLGYVLVSVSDIAPNSGIRNVAIGAGGIAIISVTSALIAVLSHLKKNRIAVYSEELNQVLCQQE